MKRNSQWAAAVLLLLVSLSLGCYTMLKHPHVEAAREAQQEEEEFGFEARPNRVSFGDDCRSCHNDRVATYHAIAVPAPVAEPTPRWSYYYDTPWWFPYYASGNNAGNADQTEPKKRPFDRRQNSVPSESSASGGSAAAPMPAPSAGSVAKPAGDNNASSSTETKRDDGNKRAERRSNENTDDKKESSRRDRKPH
jgi:hypothetical protein